MAGVNGDPKFNHIGMGVDYISLLKNS